MTPLRCMGIYSCGGPCTDAIFQGFRVGLGDGGWVSMCDEIRSGLQERMNSVIWMALLTTTIKKPVGVASFFLRDAIS